MYQLWCETAEAVGTGYVNIVEMVQTLYKTSGVVQHSLVAFLQVLLVPVAVACSLYIHVACSSYSMSYAHTHTHTQCTTSTSTITVLHGVTLVQRHTSLIKKYIFIIYYNFYY